MFSIFPALAVRALLASMFMIAWPLHSTSPRACLPSNTEITKYVYE